MEEKYKFTEIPSQNIHEILLGILGGSIFLSHFILQKGEKGNQIKRVQRLQNFWRAQVLWEP